MPGPPEIYPRVRNSGFRLDSWPAGGFPGSDLQMVRDQLLDELDIDHGVLIPLQGHAWGPEEPEFAAELCRALNDWFTEAWLDAEPRLRASIAVPLESPDLAAAEIRRWAGDRRFVQVLLATGGESGFGRRRYWPIYEAAAEAGLPVAAHTGGLEQHRGAGWPSFYLEEHVWNGNMMGALVTSMLCEGVFTEFGRCSWCASRAGWRGRPPLWALDDAWALLREDVPHLDRPPSEELREHLWFTTQPIEEPADPADLDTVLRHARHGRPDHVRLGLPALGLRLAAGRAATFPAAAARADHGHERVPPLRPAERVRPVTATRPGSAPSTRTSTVLRRRWPT